MTSGICEMTDGRRRRRADAAGDDVADADAGLGGHESEGGEDADATRTSKEELAKAVTSAELVRLERWVGTRRSA